MSRRSATGPRAWLAQAALVLASVLVSLATAEMLLRVWPLRTQLSAGDGRARRVVREAVWQELIHQRSALPGLAYELRPSIDLLSHGVRVATNRYGMRDREPVAGSRVARVAVLGDSLTFGWGVSAEQTYPQVLEESLNASAGGACQIDVLNFGVSGYSSRDESVVLRYKAMAWHPRAVVVGYFLNDPEVDPRQPLHAHFRTRHWWQRLRLGDLLELAWLRWIVHRYGAGDYFRYLHANQGTWGTVTHAFAEMRRSVPPDVLAVVAIIPVVPAEPWANYAYRPIHAQVGAAARDAGLTVLDLLPALERYDPRQLRLSEHDRHLSPAGHRVVADALSLVLAPQLTAICMEVPPSRAPSEGRGSAPRPREQPLPADHPLRGRSTARSRRGGGGCAPHGPPPASGAASAAPGPR